MNGSAEKEFPSAGSGVVDGVQSRYKPVHAQSGRLLGHFQGMGVAHEFADRAVCGHFWRSVGTRL